MQHELVIRFDDEAGQAQVGGSDGPMGNLVLALGMLVVAQNLLIKRASTEARPASPIVVPELRVNGRDFKR